MTQQILIETNANDYMQYFELAGEAMELVMSNWSFGDWSEEAIKSTFIGFTKQYCKLIEESSGEAYDSDDYLDSLQLEIYTNEQAERQYQREVKGYGNSSSVSINRR